MLFEVVYSSGIIWVLVVFLVIDFSVVCVRFGLFSWVGLCLYSDGSSCCVVLILLCFNRFDIWWLVCVSEVLFSVV